MRWRGRGHDPVSFLRDPWTTDVPYLRDGPSGPGMLEIFLEGPGRHTPPPSPIINS